MTGKSAEFDLLCLGEAMVEFNEQPGGLYLRGHGGDTSNTAIAAARQGAAVAYVTRLGADAFGDSLLALWAAEGVDAHAVERDAFAATAVYFVTHGPDGHRFTYLRAGSAASRMTPALADPKLVARARILHVSGISQAISSDAADTVFAAIAASREARRLVCYDTNLRLSLWPIERARAIIHAGVALSDIARPGLDDARALTGLGDPDAIADFYLGLGPGIVALTLGAEGVLVATPERRERIAAPEVAAVDATGAGDAFNGAFLAEIAAGRDPFAAARYAAVAAALSTRGFGAIEPVPRRDEVEAFLHGPE
jgi:2-dehydro-3-deoxygluconokinase